MDSLQSKLDRKRRLSWVLGSFVAISIALCFPVDVLAIEGPEPTPPGGVTVIPSDSTGEMIGEYGGLDLHFINFDSSQYQTLYWGAAEPNAVGFAFDGVISSAGEDLVFNLAESSLANGIARWTGNAVFAHYSGSWNYPTLDTRLTLTVRDLGDNPIPMVQAASVGIPGSGVVIQVGDDFIANLLVEAYWGGWKPALFVFDNENTPESWGGNVLTNFSSAFYYTDVPVSGLTAISDSPTELGNSTTLTATVTGGTNILYDWELGDTNTGSGKITSHTYALPGYYTATVTATNESGSYYADTHVFIYDTRVFLPMILR